MQPGLAGVLVVLARHIALLIILPLVVGVFMFLIGRWRMVYSAESTLRPMMREQNSSRYAGLAAQFGLSLPGGTIGDPLRFYAELLKSREVLGTTVRSHYEITKANGTTQQGSLLTLLGVGGSSSQDSTRRGIERLAAATDVSVKRDAGLVTVRVVTRYPDLSLQVVRRMLAVLDSVNLVRERFQAGEERRFIETRLAAAQGELGVAEESLKRFSTQNRRYQDSPELVLEFGRLQRRVDLRQQVYITLSQSYEQSRINEVRDTPGLSIIDPPEGSIRYAGRPVRDAGVWMLVAGALTVAGLLARDAVRRFMASQDFEYAELRKALQQALPARLRGKAAV